MRSATARDPFEPYYDQFDKLCGTSGKAGNLKGVIQSGGNPYANPLGAQIAACTYCGFCEKFGCGNYSKASPQTTILPSLMRNGNFTLKTEVVGKNHAYQTMSSVNVFFDDKIFNPFIGAGAMATVIDDFNGDNFDHGGLGFVGGAYIAGMVTGGRPIEMIYTPGGTPAWGLEWKHAAAKNYLRSFSISVHGSCMSHRGNYLDLDPTYRDIHGRPMLRMTFDFTRGCMYLYSQQLGESSLSCIGGSGTRGPQPVRLGGRAPHREFRRSELNRLTHHECALATRRPAANGGDSSRFAIESPYLPTRSAIRRMSSPISNGFAK
jgi:choline dehydrogenase-like flavoprotein